MNVLARLWRSRAARRALITEEAWSRACGQVRLLEGYPRDARDRLRELAEAFLQRKEIRGAGGLEVTPEMALLFAAQASVPVLNLGLDWYRGWYTVVLYPGDFLARHEYVDEAGVVHEEERALSGESWEQGPVLVSWGGVEEGARGELWGNLVIHELAHKLDALNGAANGLPPLHAGLPRAAWTDAFTRAFEDLNRRLDAGGDIALDEYAGEDPAEFFAVASEAFFTEAHELRAAYPEVYAQLAAFYRQDPARELRPPP